MTGTLNIDLIAERIAAVESARPVLAALAFIIVGISLKLALFPLHVWLPNAYAYAPSVATTFLAATATKVAIYLFVRYRLHGLRRRLRLRRPAGHADPRGVVDRRDLRRRHRRDVPVGRQADARLFLGRADRLHHARPRAWPPPPALTGGLVHLFNHALIKARCSWRLGAVVLPRRHGSGSRISPGSAGACR